jgi:acyl-coenzyme A thioesterase PaaI-like protein
MSPPVDPSTDPGAERPTSLFTRDGEAFVATALSTSPWSTESLHGGPVAALLAHHLATVPTTGRFFPARLTVELFRPVSFEPYRVDCLVVRSGRKVMVVGATLARDPDRPPCPDTIVARATLQQIAVNPVTLPDDVHDVNGPDRRPPAPEQCEVTPGTTGLADVDGGTRFHLHGVEHRATTDLFRQRGRVVDWIRVPHHLLPGKPLTPFERVAAAADFGNGISGVLTFDDYSFVNPDLTIHLFRLPVDEWVCLDAVTRINGEPGMGSIGLAESALFDRRGRIGRSLQSLVISEVD